MTTRGHRLAWLPPFVVGTSAAIAAETAVGLLLYGGPGFVRSLTVVLAVSGLSLAGGLWSAPSGSRPRLPTLRRRWLACLAAFLAASAFGAVWSMPGLLGEGRPAQALGLVFLAAAPLYASGAVLAGLAALPTAIPIRTGAAAVSGAGIGFVLTGLLLPRTPLPATLLLACLVLLSVGGMVFGSVLESVSEVEVREEREGPDGPVRVEERRRLGEEVGPTVLVERGYPRRQHPPVAGGEPWDVAVARALMPPPERPWRLLAVGGGASTLAKSVVREHPTATVDVLDRSEVVVELGRRHLGTELFVGVDERVRVRVGHMEDLLKEIRDRYDTVVVDGAALRPTGRLSREARARIAQAVEPGGVLAWSGELAPGTPEPASRWPVRTIVRGDEEKGEPVEVVHLLARVDGEPPALVVDGFTVRNGEPQSS